MFLLVYDSYAGGSIVTFSMYTYIVPWFGASLHSSLFSLIPLLKMTSSCQCSIFINIQKVHQPYSPSLTLFIYPPSPTSALPLTYLFYIPVLHCSMSVHCSVGFCLDILPVNILYFNQSNSSITLPYPFPPTLHCSTFSVCFTVSCSYTDVMFLNIIHSIILFFFSSSLSFL
jgi:hypothetical protein